MRTHEAGADVRPEHYALSRTLIAVLGGYVVVAAGLLVYVRRYASEHPVAIILELLGFPTFIGLVFFIVLRRRRRNENGDAVE